MDYYNEFDEYPLQWLRNLSAVGHIPGGTFDGRSIVDVKAEDLNGVRSAHFFAGIGGWPLALKLAGWPEDQEVWTGSCPCQPFSVAGKRAGNKDKRHLWPEFFRLIGKRRPPVIFGEQVASNDGRAWLSGVRSDLESLGYEVGAADLCAAGAGEEGEGWILRGDSFSVERTIIGAPHIRQRLFWVANRLGEGLERLPIEPSREERSTAERSGLPCGLADGEGAGLRGGLGKQEEEARGGESRAERCGPVSGMDNSASARRHAQGEGAEDKTRNEARMRGLECRRPESDSDFRVAQSDSWKRGQRDLPKQTGADASNSWSNFDVLPFADGKARRVESRTFPLVDGVPARVGKLRAYGNAIVPEEAAIFIKAFLSLGNLLRRR